MGLLNRFRLGPQRETAYANVASRARVHPAALQTPTAGPSFAPRTVRPSSSLKDFLWHMSGLGRGTLLDLGPVWQSTVSFFVERGFKVSTEDLLSGWKQFTQEDTERQRSLPADAPRATKAELAAQFLEESLRYPAGSFDAVLAWDLLDYLDEDIMRRTAERLSALVREGGVILSVFHSQRPEQFHRYRVLDERTLEMVASPALVPVARIFQNREITELFSRFHTSKTYLGRDQLREALFVK